MCQVPKYRAVLHRTAAAPSMAACRGVVPAELVSGNAATVARVSEVLGAGAQHVKREDATVRIADARLRALSRVAIRA